jgi:L-threonylcarbamoyladenylate synthase
MKIFALNAAAPEPKLVNEIASLLKEGGTIAYPTDTLYGLGADAFNRDAYHRIGILKGRDGRKPFPHVVDKPERLNEWQINITPIAAAIIDEFWPGPVSLIFQDTGNLPTYTLGPSQTVCLRIPDCAIARSIAGALGGLLVATSANPSGRPAACSAQEAIGYFRGEIDAVIDGGPSICRMPSTIVDVTHRKAVIVREGAVPAEKLRAVLAEIQEQP